MKKIISAMSCMICSIWIISCSSHEGQPKNEGAGKDTFQQKVAQLQSPLSLGIPPALGQSMTHLFKETPDYYIPDSWIFERDTIRRLLESPNVVGLRLYAGIYEQDSSYADKLRLILVAVTPINGVNRDNPSYGLYEFSDMCPPVCKTNSISDGHMRSSIPQVRIPRSWYFRKLDFDEMLQNYPGMFGIRFQCVETGGDMGLRAFPVQYPPAGGNIEDVPGWTKMVLGAICFDHEADCDEDGLLYLSNISR